MEEMKDTFKRIAENYKDVFTRFIIISMLAMTNNYVYSFLVEMIYVLAFMSNRTFDKDQITSFMTLTIDIMAKKTDSYNNLFNSYLEEGRLALIKDAMAYIEKQKKKNSV